MTTGHRIGQERGLELFSKTTHNHDPSAGPTSIDPDDAQTTGTGPGYAFQDHQHAISAASAGTITDTNAEGSSGSFARADHDHAYGADSIDFPDIDESTFPATTAATVATSEGTTSTSYTDLATTGPSVTMTPPASGKVMVSIYAQYQGSGTNGQLMSFALSSGNTLAAADARSIGSNQVAALRGGATFLLTGLSASSTVFTAKYRTGNAANTATFADRHMIVEPVLA